MKISNITKKHSVVYLMGGLGNQLFQLCFANSLRMNGHKVTVDLSNYSKKNDKDKIPIREQIFPVSYFKFDEPSNLVKSILKFYAKLSNYKFKNVMFVPIKRINENNLNIVNQGLLNHFVGYWQDLNVILENKSFLIDSLSNDKNLEFSLNATPELGSTMIHVRRGDYVDINEDLKLDYFSKAIELCSNEIKNFNFNVFTDDIKWVKDSKIFKNANNIFGSTNTKENTIISFSKMLLHENFIISNSTFSLIAAVLGSNENSKIYLPEPWFRNENKDIKPFSSWIKINNYE